MGGVDHRAARCGLLIDDTVEDLPGAPRCATDVRRGRTLVTYHPTRVTPDEVAAAIVEAGYTVAPLDEGSG